MNNLLQFSEQPDEANANIIYEQGNYWQENFSEFFKVLQVSKLDRMVPMFLAAILGRSHKQ